MREVLMQNYAPGKDAGMAHTPHIPRVAPRSTTCRRNLITPNSHAHTNRDLERVDIYKRTGKVCKPQNATLGVREKTEGACVWILFAGFINYWCSSPRGNLRPNLFAFAGSLAASVSLAVSLFGAVKRCGNLRRRERYARGFVLQGVPFVGRKFARFPLWLYVRFTLINISTGNFSRDCIASIIEALLCSET